MAVFAMFAFTSCDGMGVNSKSSISLDPVMLTMTVGDIQVINATIHPTDADILWTSSNDSVATVTQGVVTATGVGNATITATIGENTSATCLVYSVGKSGATLALRPIQVSLKKGETYQMKVENVYGLSLTWTSDNEEVVTVDNNGLLTAKNSGVATISVTNGSETVTSFVDVAYEWGEYKEVWRDEFDGATLNREVWTPQVGGGGFGNQEKQYYTEREENLRLKDGCLEIELRKEEYEKHSYTSARMSTKNKLFFTYGIIEARIQLPSGGGSWPAFWMMGNNYDKVGWPLCGEIDIMEHVGNTPLMTSFALHTRDKNGMAGDNWHAADFREGMEGEFHTYGIIWEKGVQKGCDRIAFTVDGEICAQVYEEFAHRDEPRYWPFNQDFFILLNMAVGGTMGGKIDDGMFAQPVVMKVDWVRVLQREEL